MITLSKEQAEKIQDLLREYASATDNILYQYMGIPSKPQEKTELDIKLEEIYNAISLLENYED